MAAAHDMVKYTISQNVSIDATARCHFRQYVIRTPFLPLQWQLLTVEYFGRYVDVAFLLVAGTAERSGRFY